MPKKPVSDLTQEKLLELEFTYIQSTLTQITNDRYTLLNFYIALSTAVGGIGVSLLTFAKEVPAAITLFAIPLLNLLLFFVGIIFLAMQIRLRQAWYESVRAMNMIKNYYAEEFPQVNSAILWNMKSLPRPHRLWNIHFFGVLLITIIDSVFLAVAIALWYRDINGLNIALIAFWCSVAIQVIAYRVALSFNL